MSTAVRERYQSLVKADHLERDAAQSAVVGRLDMLIDDLARRPPASKGGALGWLLRKVPEAPPRGLYIWGSVGRGKTMLMDLFFAAVPVQRKRRTHFHAFMGDVHARVYAWRQAKKRGEVREEEPIASVAAALAAEATLVCLDEFSVTDIADAMILGRLFEALFALGVTLVATSNVAPADLYKEGLNRSLFTPFLQLLSTRVEVLRLDARADFRLEKLAGETVYHVPADAAATRALDRSFRKLAGSARGEPMELDVLGRKVVVPQAAAGVARFTFAELCEEAHGAADYLAIARHFHTVVLDAIPVIAPDERNTAKRFIILVDTFYDRHIKLLASAAAEPGALYGGVNTREAFEFERTASRLIEMRSTEYLGLPHGRADSAASGDSSGIVET